MSLLLTIDNKTGVAMSFRFSKRIKIAPGIKLNVSTKGVSTTVGPKGMSVNVGKKGAYLNAGLPGTGISSRTKIASANTSNTTRVPQSSSSGLIIGIVVVAAVILLAFWLLA